MHLREFTESYIRTALWAETDGDEPLDKRYTEAEIAPETLARMRADAESFYAAHCGLFGARGASRAGHDLWLTRNGHGAGFWDGDWPEPAATILTESAHAMGECSLYVGDDGLIHAL